MKRYLFLVTLLSAFVTGSIAHAQDTTQTTTGQRQGVARGAGGGGQRQGGVATQPENQTKQAYQDGVKAYQDAITSGNRAVSLTSAVTALTFTSPWWNNATTVAKVGLTDLQKSRIEGTFEAHRQNLASRKDQLEKEEAQLSRLLDAESIDRGAVFTQINRVIQARGEMERENASMTLEMREQLTRAQWTQVQSFQVFHWEVAPVGGLGPGTGLGLSIGTTTQGGRGGRGGARSGNPAQQ